MTWVQPDAPDVNVKMVPGKMMTGPGKKLYPFQWIYRLNIKGFYWFPYVVMVALLLGVVPLILYSVGVPVPQQSQIPIVKDIMAQLGIFSDRDLFVIATWLLWWPLFIFTILLFRRIWCGGFCPFGLITDMGNWVGRKLRGEKDPKAISTTNYVFMGFLTFLIIGYLHDAVNITNSIIMSIEFVLFFFIFAFITGVVLPRRSFCRSFCFVGGLPHLFGRLAFLGLKTDRRKCEKCEGKWCQTGTHYPPQGIAELKPPLINVDGCPMYLNVPQLGHLESNRHCILCGNCVKNCPYDAIHYQYLEPGYEIHKGLQLNGHETFFTLGIISVLGMFIAMEGTLLNKWGELLTVAFQLPSVKFHWAIAGSFVLLTAAVMFSLYFLVSAATAALLNFSKKNIVTWFGYIYLPFCYLMFFRDIFVVYLVDGSIIQVWLGKGPQWMLLIVPFIEDFLIVVSAAWSIYLAFVLVRIAWERHHPDKKMEWQDHLAGAFPHIILVLALAGYWLWQIFPEHMERFVVLGVKPWMAFAIPLAAIALFVIAKHLGAFRALQRLDPEQWEA